MAILTTSLGLVVAWHRDPPAASAEAPGALSVPPPRTRSSRPTNPQDHASEPTPSRPAYPVAHHRLPQVRPARGAGGRTLTARALSRPRPARSPAASGFRGHRTAWKADGLAAGTRPALGQLLAVTPDGPQTRHVFDVSTIIHGSGRTRSRCRTQPLTSPRSGTRSNTERTVRASSLSGRRAARALSRRPATTDTSPGPARSSRAGRGSPATAPSGTGSPSQSGKPGGPAGPLPQSVVPRGATLAGATIHVRDGENFAQALARADRTFGPLRMVRVFYPGLPPAWGGSRSDVVNRTVVVSFKAHPREVNCRPARRPPGGLVRLGPPGARRLLGLLPRARERRRERLLQAGGLQGGLAPDRGAGQPGRQPAADQHDHPHVLHAEPGLRARLQRLLPGQRR